MHNQGHGGKSRHLPGFRQDFLKHLMLAVLGIRKISTALSMHIIQPNLSDANNILLSQIGSQMEKRDILLSIVVLQSMLWMDAKCRLHRLLLHEMKRSIPVFNEIASYRRFNAISSKWDSEIMVSSNLDLEISLDANNCQNSIPKLRNLNPDNMKIWNPFLSS